MQYSPILDEDMFYQVPTLLIETKVMHNINEVVHINYEGIEKKIHLVESLQNLKPNWSKEDGLVKLPINCFQDLGCKDGGGEQDGVQQREESGDLEIDEVKGSLNKTGKMESIDSEICDLETKFDDQVLPKESNCGGLVVGGDDEDSDSLVNPLTPRDHVSL